jgi:hypothetical protein
MRYRFVGDLEQSREQESIAQRTLEDLGRASDTAWVSVIIAATG